MTLVGRRDWLVGMLAGAWLGVGCRDANQDSPAQAASFAQWLAQTSTGDVEEIRRGLPLGAQLLSTLWPPEAGRVPSADEAKVLLDRTRSKTQSLRVAKATFFALVDANGVVLRSDQSVDQLAGESLWGPFGDLQARLGQGYAEALGSLPQVHGVRGKPDGEWVAAQPVQLREAVVGYLVGGWAWSAYAYRLEFALRGRLTTESRQSGAKLPLVYVFVVTEQDVVGSPEAPQVNADAIAALRPLASVRERPEHPVQTRLTITGRDFGLGIVACPEHGGRVAIAVLYSAT